MVHIANVFPDLKASIHVVFSITLLHVTANYELRTESRPTRRIKRKIISHLLLQMVLSASARAIASLGGKLWLLSVRFVVPRPAKSLRGGQEFELQNLGRLPITST